MRQLHLIKKNLKYLFYTALSGFSTGGFFVAENMNIFVESGRKRIFFELLNTGDYVWMVALCIAVYIIVWLIYSKTISVILKRDTETVLKEDSLTYLPSILLIIPLLFKTSPFLLNLSNFGIYLAEDFKWFLFGYVLLCIVLLKGSPRPHSAPQDPSEKRGGQSTVQTLRGITVIIFLVSFIVILLGRTGFIPLKGSSARESAYLGGDEPHYLLITHSLAFDRDFDLKNNISLKHYEGFSDRPVDGHSKKGYDGGMYSVHRLGLPLIASPAYYIGHTSGIGERSAVVLFLNILSALLAVNIFLLCYEYTSDIRSSLIAWVASTFTIPLLPYSSQIFPELPVALLLVYAFRRIRRSNSEISGRTGIAFMGLLVGFLPWFHEKYIPLTLILSAIFIVFNRKYIGRIVYFMIPIIISFILQGLYYYKLNGFPFPAVTGVHEPLINPEGFYRGLLGLFIDSGAGIIPQSPVFLTVFAGSLFMLKEKRKDFILLLLIFLALYPLIGIYTSWFGGKCPPARYMVPLIPLLSVTMAFAFKEIVRRGFTFIIYLLIALSLYISFSGMANPGKMFTYRHILDNAFLYFVPGDYLPQFIVEKGYILTVKTIFTSLFILLVTSLIYRTSEKKEAFLSIKGPVKKILFFIGTIIGLLFIHIYSVDRIAGVEVSPGERAVTHFWERHFSQRWEKVKMNGKTADRSYLNTIRLRYEAERYSHLPAVIVEDDDASDGKAALINRGSQGYVTWGQYRRLPSGSYKAIYRLKLVSKGGSDTIGYIDISAERGKNIIAKKYIYPADFDSENTYNVFSLEFGLTKEVKDIEFRVYSSGGEGFIVDSIEIGISI